MIVTGSNQELRGKTVPMPLCPPQIPHGITRARNRASEVRGRRLIAQTMAEPYTGAPKLYLQFQEAIRGRT
jgi:hypothetical protein